ncbi:unnamed protein product [Vicia faba]|uniref:Uncharacterized protein n=1 Tax=Vicia faba TaxID=3906 RepID=A0AAV0ZD03_VICFA|nr:unnamed protein product [Vicia faba]
MNKFVFSLKQALICFVHKSGSPVPIFTPMIGSSPRRTNSKSLSRIGRGRSYSLLEGSSWSKRVSNDIKSTFGGAFCTSALMGCGSDCCGFGHTIAAFLAGRSPALIVLCPLAITLKHLRAASRSPWMVATRALFVKNFIFIWTVEGTAVSSASVGLLRMQFSEMGSR